MHEAYVLSAISLYLRSEHIPLAGSERRSRFPPRIHSKPNIALLRNGCISAGADWYLRPKLRLHADQSLKTATAPPATYRSQFALASRPGFAFVMEEEGITKCYMEKCIPALSLATPVHLSRFYLRRRFDPMFDDWALVRVEEILVIMRHIGLLLGHLHFRLATGEHLLVVHVDGFLKRHFSLLDGHAGVDEALTVLERVVTTLAAI